MRKAKADQVSSLTYDELKALEHSYERITTLLAACFPPGKTVVFKRYSTYKRKGPVTRYYEAKVIEARFTNSEIEVVVFHNERAKVLKLRELHIPDPEDEVYRIV